MDYIEARKYIDDIMAGKGSIPGLSSIKNLLDLMDNPQNKVSVIHVAGTNGKGSAVAFISQVLVQAGYKTGVYMSPSVFEYRERMKINNRFISENEYADEISYICRCVNKMKENGQDIPTAFEMETAAAFDYFVKQGCDIAVIETGFGGKEDATNVCDNPLVSVIMSVSMDHMNFLGDTLEEIAMAKAGIIKRNTDAVLYRQSEKVMDIVKDTAQENNCTLRITGSVTDVEYGCGLTKFTYQSKDNIYRNIKIRLLGTFQPENAAAAIEACEIIRQKGFDITDESIYQGLYNAVHHGRFEKIGDKPLFFMDGAHNAGALKCLKDTMDTYFCDMHLIFIMGVLADKDFGNIIKDIAGCADYILTVTPYNIRALPAGRLADSLDGVSQNIEAAESVYDAVKKALAIAEKYGNEDTVIMAFGSLSYLGELKSAYDGMEDY